MRFFPNTRQRVQWGCDANNDAGVTNGHARFLLSDRRTGNRKRIPGGPLLNHANDAAAGLS